MVIERQDVWYIDDGGLSYTLCEDNSPLAEPPVSCCSSFLWAAESCRRSPGKVRPFKIGP
jgi:hypothetical protein